MVKLVIFDWDGTLFDSLDKICDSMLEAACLANAPLRSSEDVKDIIGLSLDKGIQRIWPELSAHEHEQIKEHYKAAFVANDQIPPKAYPKVLTTLYELQEEGVMMAVATGKSRRGLERAFNLTNIRDFFAASRCADETLSKPDPLMLNELLSELDVSADQAIMVGDTEYDLNMATNAGMKSIGVTYGAHDESRLKSCQPHALVNNFNELLDVLGIK